MPKRATSIRIRELSSADDPALEGAYRLLTREFAREERVTLSDWRNTLAEMEEGVLTDMAWHLLVAEQDGALVGLTSGTYLGNVNIGVIGYLAMSPAVRSRGIGTRLRARLRRQFERDALRIAEAPLEAVIGEVSHDNRWLRTLATREEVLLLDFDYYQPELYPSDDASPYVLYYESVGRIRRRIPVAELRRLLYTCWRRVYRVNRPLQHPAFRAMLRSIGDRRVIGPLDLRKPRTTTR